MVSCKSREAANPQQGNKRRRFVLPLNWHLPLDGPRAPRDQVQVVGRVPEQNARCRFGEVHAARLGRGLHARRGIHLRREKGEGGAAPWDEHGREYTQQNKGTWIRRRPCLRRTVSPNMR